MHGFILGALCVIPFALLAYDFGRAKALRECENYQKHAIAAQQYACGLIDEYTAKLKAVPPA